MFDLHNIMREILKMIGGLLIVALLIAHFFLVALFVAPADKLLGLFMPSNQGFLVTQELPEPVEDFLVNNHVEVAGDYRIDQSHKGRLILGILQLRKQYFMNVKQQLALDANLLNYGEDLVGVKSASEYYYDKPLSETSDWEWITLVNLHSISSKK